MGLIKDPDVDITQFDEILFDEVFSDINTPGIWIAKTQEDLDKAKIIVLDGHSTLLEYNQSNKDLPWTAYNDLGQYKYKAENMGDGLVIFSHHFYFQFSMRVGNKEVFVESNLDGNGIKAIALPMKDVPITQFFEIVTKRLEDAITSEIQSFGDTITIEIGKKIVIPEAVLMKIGMKLSMMGIALTSIKPKEITELDILEGEDVEHHFDESPSEMQEMLKTEEKETKKKQKGAKRKKSAPMAKMDAEEKIDTRSRSVNLGGGGAAPPPVSAKASSGSAPGGPPSPPPPPATAAPPPKVLSAEPTPIPESLKPSAPVPVTAKSEIPLAKPVIMEEEIEEADEFGDIAGMAVEDMDDDMDDALIAKGMEVTESKMTLRYTHTSYFSRMLLNRAYPLVVKISTEEVGVKKTITSVVSGEKISEKEESIIFDEQKSVVIRPEFPGCFVVPSEQEVELSDKKIEVKFHVTPLALGLLEGSVKFIQSRKTVQVMLLETKVITHRLSRWLATIGASASVVPTMVAFMVNETPAQFMEDRMENFAPSIGVNGLAILGLFTAFFLFLSGFVYRLQKPKRSSSSLAFPR